MKESISVSVHNYTVRTVNQKKSIVESSLIRNDTSSKEVVRELEISLMINVIVHVPFIHKFVMLGVTRFPLHNVTLCLLICQGDGRNLTRKKKSGKNGSAS